MPERRSSNWLWFFAVLAALGAAAAVIPVVYNLRRQLTAEQVVAARQRWLAAEPADYDLDYQEKQTHRGQTEETAFYVAVRGRRVAAVGSNGELVLLAGTGAALVLGPWAQALPGASGARDVDGMFDHIEDQLRRDASQARRPYTTATFDKRDGHPTRYVRRTRGGAERLELTVKLTRVGG
jgi:hypothetical protein